MLFNLGVLLVAYPLFGLQLLRFIPLDRLLFSGDHNSVLLWRAFDEQRNEF